jgi:hypothetical protein
MHEQIFLCCNKNYITDVVVLLSRRVNFAFWPMYHLAYKIAKMIQNISCILPMGQNAYVSFGLLGHLILPTGILPM